MAPDPKDWEPDAVTPVVDWEPDAETLTECPICGGVGEIMIQFSSGIQRTQKDAMKKGGHWVRIGCEACSGDARKVGTGRVTRSQKEKLTRRK